MAGTQEVLLQTVEAIVIGGSQIKDFRTQFGDVAGEFGFGGILGGDILNALGAVINYSASIVEFSALGRAKQ